MPAAFCSNDARRIAIAVCLRTPPGGSVSGSSRPALRALVHLHLEPFPLSHLLLRFQALCSPLPAYAQRSNVLRPTVVRDPYRLVSIVFFSGRVRHPSYHERVASPTHPALRPVPATAVRRSPALLAVPRLPAADRCAFDAAMRRLAPPFGVDQGIGVIEPPASSGVLFHPASSRPRTRGRLRSRVAQS